MTPTAATTLNSLLVGGAVDTSTAARARSGTVADPSPHEDREGAAAADAPLMDAQRLLAFTERLRAVHALIDEVAMPSGRRGGYQRRLAAAADTARADLEKAEAQLERLEADLDRQIKP